MSPRVGRRLTVALPVPGRCAQLHSTSLRVTPCAVARVAPLRKVRECCLRYLKFLAIRSRRVLPDFPTLKRHVDETLRRHLQQEVKRHSPILGQVSRIRQHEGRTWSVGYGQSGAGGYQTTTAERALSRNETYPTIGSSCNCAFAGSGRLATALHPNFRACHGSCIRTTHTTPVVR